jgi:4-hydroxybenzoyl-CoA reductase subunit beta
MLPFPTFKLERPDNLSDALALVTAPDSRILAGGTDLLPNLKHRLEMPDTLVSLSRVNALQGITSSENGLRIGATTTLAAVAAHPMVDTQYPALAAACRTVATSTIQEMGTLGGNLLLDTRCRYLNQPVGWRTAIGGCLKCKGNTCHVAREGRGCYAAHSADTVPVLWLMGAEVVIASTEGERQVPISALYKEDGIDRTVLQRGDLLTAIVLPKPRGFVAHRKLRLRGSIDYPLLLVAVLRAGAGATAVISAVGPRPITVSVDRAQDLPDAAHAATRPLNTHLTSTLWRRHMVRVEVARALEATTR